MLQALSGASDTVGPFSFMKSFPACYCHHPPTTVYVSAVHALGVEQHRVTRFGREGAFDTLTDCLTGPGTTCEPEQTYTRHETNVPNAMIELPKDYRFCYPSTWEEEPVSRNDSNAYGMDVHFVRKGYGELMVNLLPYSKDSMDMATIARFVNSASMSSSLNLREAEQVLADQRSSGGKQYFQFEYKKPYACVSATVVDRALYVLTASATDSRRWAKMQNELRAVAESFFVPT
eukprot:scaffold452406_cov36-Prasinocladus_malaysianus.AAC.4